MIKNKKGVTLIEILLSAAIIVALAGIAMPVYQSFQANNDLDIAASNISASLRRAQVLARAADGDSSWGVRIESDKIVIFRGSSYSGRDSIFDEIFNMPAGISSSGIQEIVFAKFSGVPQTSGNIVLASVVNESRTISVNAKGTVAY